MSSSTPRINRSFLSVVLLFLIATLLLSSSSVQAQSPSVSPSPTTDPVTVSATPSPDVTTPSASPSASSVSPGVTVTATATATSTTSTATATPVPIFSSSENCVACSAQYSAISTCMSRVPTAGNLTMINQVLPFYQCICPNNGTEIDALQQCSICLRSTGQQAFLNRAFYNVTNQDVKAMKEVCLETAEGTMVPSGSSGRWDMLISTASWGVVSAMMLALLPLGGL